MNPKQKARIKEIADRKYPKFLHPDKHAGLIEGMTIAYAEINTGITPDTEKTPQDKRIDRVVELAMQAIAKKPDNIRYILTDLYEAAQKDFEAYCVDVRIGPNNDLVHTYKRTFAKWNPPVGGSGD